MSVGLDGHTLQGRTALAKVAARHGRTLLNLSELMFFCESCRLGPEERPVRWRDEALAIVSRDNKWGTFADAQEQWAQLRDEVQRLIDRGR